MLVKISSWVGRRSRGFPADWQKTQRHLLEVGKAASLSVKWWAGNGRRGVTRNDGRSQSSCTALSFLFFCWEESRDLSVHLKINGESFPLQSIVQQVQQCLISANFFQSPTFQSLVCQWRRWSTWCQIRCPWKDAGEAAAYWLTHANQPRWWRGRWRWCLCWPGGPKESTRWSAPQSRWKITSTVGAVARWNLTIVPRVTISWKVSANVFVAKLTIEPLASSPDSTGTRRPAVAAAQDTRGPLAQPVTSLTNLHLARVFSSQPSPPRVFFLPLFCSSLFWWLFLAEAFSICAELDDKEREAMLELPCTCCWSQSWNMRRGKASLRLRRTLVRQFFSDGLNLNQGVGLADFPLISSHYFLIQIIFCRHSQMESWISTMFWTEIWKKKMYKLLKNKYNSLIFSFNFNEKHSTMHYGKVEKWAKKYVTLKILFSMVVDAKGTKF